VESGLIEPVSKSKSKERIMSSNKSAGGSSQEMTWQLTLEIASINVHLEQIRQFWARALGITSPQWMLLMAIADTDDKHGVPLNAVSKRLHIDPSFVTTQSKLLEKKGFLRRKVSSSDARVLLMSLTDKTAKHLARLAEQQQSLSEFIFEEFSDRELSDLKGKLGILKIRLEKACRKIELDL
jgi:DNA-binding MarR family transcriptional regulator